MSLLIKTNSVNKVIPDNSNEGLVDAIKVFKGGSVSDIEVRVNIEHPYSGDLEVALTAPSGKSAILHSRNGSSDPNLVKTFEGDAMAEFVGEKVKGDWKIVVKDYAPRDEGKLLTWTLRVQNDVKSENSEIFIPDGEGKKLVSKQACNVAGKIKNISASVEIEHGYIGDLEVVLKGPEVAVKLHDRDGGNKKDLKETYNNEALAEFIGTKAKGVWALEVSDHAPRDSGRIKSWHVDLVV